MKKGKSIIDFANIELEQLEAIAKKNNRNTSKQGLIKLAVDIANNSFKYLDKESFEQVTNLEV
jgi:hypothetical protein